MQKNTVLFLLINFNLSCAFLNGYFKLKVFCAECPKCGSAADQKCRLDDAAQQAHSWIATYHPGQCLSEEKRAFLQGVWWQSFGVGPVGIPLFCAVINAYYFCMFHSIFWHHLKHAPACCFYV
jgi:hypothetical protein